MARTFFYIKNMKEKTIKAICTETNPKGTFEMNIIARIGIQPGTVYTNGGDVKSYWVKWVAKQGPEHFCHFIPTDPGYIFIEKMNKTYHFSNPKEFEEMRNDIEALCALAMLED